MCTAETKRDPCSMSSGSVPLCRTSLACFKKISTRQALELRFNFRKENTAVEKNQAEKRRPCRPWIIFVAQNNYREALAANNATPELVNALIYRVTIKRILARQLELVEVAIGHIQVRGSIKSVLITMNRSHSQVFYVADSCRQGASGAVKQHAVCCPFPSCTRAGANARNNNFSSCQGLVFLPPKGIGVSQTTS